MYDDALLITVNMHKALCAKGSTRLILINSHCKHRGWELSPHFTDEKTGSESLSHSPEVTQLASSRVRIQMEV